LSDLIESGRGSGGTATPLLSVLIPCWNAATTIERALASVLEERGVPLECVVIDDGSTDGTAEIVAAMAARDPRIVLVRLPGNAGVSAARNAGLAVAQGAWLTFVDADDRLLPGAVTALMGPTSDPGIKVVIGQRIWTDGERSWVTSLYDTPDIRTPGRTSLAGRPGLLYYASATGRVLHRSVIGDRRFQGRVLGDQPWTIHAMLRAGDGIEVIGDTIYEWLRPHPDRYLPTLTAETRSSAERAVEMADVARAAFLEVCADVDALVPVTARRPIIKRVYFERLVRADIADRLRVAADRRDPATGALYDAVGASSRPSRPLSWRAPRSTCSTSSDPPPTGMRHLPRRHAGATGGWSDRSWRATRARAGGSAAIQHCPRPSGWHGAVDRPSASPSRAPSYGPPRPSRSSSVGWVWPDGGRTRASTARQPDVAVIGCDDHGAQPEHLSVTDRSALRRVDGVDDERGRSVERIPVDDPVRRHHDDHIGPGHERLQGDALPDAARGVLEGADMGVMEAHVGTSLRKAGQDLGRRRVPLIPDIRLEGHSDDSHLRPFERTATIVEGFGDEIDDVARHGDVDISRQFDEPIDEVELPRPPGQVVRVDRDAVATDAGTGRELHEPERLGGGGVDDLPDIEAMRSQSSAGLLTKRC
jgi:glycosyltransferase involved in cell wall biosynthesis